MIEYKGRESDKTMIIKCENMYEYRLMRDRILRAKKIIEGCNNNPANKKIK